MTDQELMQKIQDSQGDVIRQAVKLSSIPEKFLAALIANESAGDPKAVRFEADTFKMVCLVILGRKATFQPQGIHHPLGSQDFLAYVDPSAIGGPVLAGGFRGMLMRVGELATSYGLTQIMGWHAIEFSKTLAAITDSGRHLDFAVFLLTYFANRYQLDLTTEFEELFRCWNTGRPDGQTFDPQYVPNGLARMQVYVDLASSSR